MSYKPALSGVTSFEAYERRFGKVRNGHIFENWMPMWGWTSIWILHIYWFIFSAIWCVTLVPYPSVTVTRYNRQSFNCSVDPNWSAVAYVYGIENIALFSVQDGKCKDFLDQSSGLYTTDCDDSTRTFYLTIKNVTDDYNGKIIQCKVTYSAGVSSQQQSIIHVQCK